MDGRAQTGYNRETCSHPPSGVPPMRSLLALPALALLAAHLAAADPVAADRVAALQKLIRPSAGEDRWAAIPWHTSLWEARKVAAKEGKPILLWEMDGHPLGCT